MFLQSAKELKAVTTLAACAMFAALAMILNQVASIDIGPYVRIGFSGIPNRLVDYLFGPVTGCLFSGILDVVKYFLKPSGPFFFGFTFNAMLASFMYGCFYYRKKLTIKRVLAAKFIVMLTVNVLLNTLWISMLYGKGIMVLLPAQKELSARTKKEADGFCRKRKAKKNCGRNFPKRKPAAVLFV